MPIYNLIGTVTTSGTPVPIIGVPTLCDWFLITPDVLNTGAIYLGALSTVSKAAGYPLNIGDSTVGWPMMNYGFGPPPYDLSLIGIDADTNGNKIRVLYGRRS